MRAELPTVVRLDRATVVQGGTTILDEVSWELRRGEHAVVLGPNGAGKTTLLRLLAGYRQPTRGTVEVLGGRLGSIDVRALRRRVGILSDALEGLITRRTNLRGLVAAGVHGVTMATRRELDAESLARADTALAAVGIGHLGDRRGTEVSEGEWKRARLARALVAEPELLLLDEPCSGLDLAQREEFLHTLDTALAAPGGPTLVLVTHHLDEVSTATTSQAVLLRDGRAVASGEVTETLTSQLVSATFGVPVTVERRDGRFSARMRPAT